MNEFTVRLDLAKGKARQQQTVFVRQGDTNGTTIVATITDHGAAAATSGMTARFQMRLPDGTHYYRKAASLSGNVATVALDEAQAASAVGRTDTAYFQLLQGSTVVASTESFTVIVLPDALADATVPESYDSAIQDAIDALDAAVEQLPATVEDVLADHPEWTTTVQDGSITKAKLATDLARDRERLLYRLDNLLTNALPEGDVATATDAAQTPMAGLSVYGQSTQDGTPTPSAPVPIVSVEGDSEGNISLWARGRNLLNPGKALYLSGLTIGAYDSESITFEMRGASSFAIFDLGISGDVTLTLSATSSSSSTRIGCGYLRQDGSDRTIVRRTQEGTSHTMTASMTVPEGYVAGLWVYPAISESSGTAVITHLQVERGTTPTAYIPYVETVTPIPLDGHELRSLPDGTRDEVTVGADGHAVLVQRVGEVDPSTLAWKYVSGTTSSRFTCRYSTLKANSRMLCTKLASATSYWDVYNHVVDNSIIAHPSVGQFELYASAYTSDSALAAALAGSTLLFALATPVTHDLGYVAAVPLCGPDLTAQAIPTAPFALTYERDLNTTLARLESAIANLV